ncbi:MAG TPA: sulfite exporter TauE/SafE family protein [Parvibaculum sp.]
MGQVWVSAVGPEGVAALLIACGIVFAAFFVRGYTGFGASLIAVATLTFLWPPAVVVPVIFGLEILASLALLPGVWRQVNWSSLKLLCLGTLVATPLGIFALTAIPAKTMTVVIAVLVAVAAITLLVGVKSRLTPGPVTTLATGGLVGLLNGATAIGGPPAVLFYFSNAAGIATGRASLIAFFFVTDVIALGFAGASGLYENATIPRVAILAPAMLAGAFAGARAFRFADPETVRRAALILLLVMAAVRLVGVFR